MSLLVSGWVVDTKNEGVCPCRDGRDFKGEKVSLEIGVGVDARDGIGTGDVGMERDGDTGSRVGAGETGVVGDKVAEGRINGGTVVCCSSEEFGLCEDDDVG